MKAILSVTGLTVKFRISGNYYNAVNGVDFDLFENETLCIVGESGCGKSLAALSLLGLQPPAPLCQRQGKILYRGTDLQKLSEDEMARLRGNKIAMIFQEPMTSLNPVLKVGRQIAEPLVIHKGLSWKDANIEAKNLLDLVRIPDAANRLQQFPHQLSGGMRQRVMIAIGLACSPDILIADEPTTALDVTIQAQVLALLAEVRKEHGLALILITHDLGVVANVADRIAVMYAGDIVETASVEDVFNAPQHPYTQALLRSVPRSDRRDQLFAIAGQVPSIHTMPPGCRFAPRCSEQHEKCATRADLIPAESASHLVRCWARQAI